MASLTQIEKRVAALEVKTSAHAARLDAQDVRITQHDAQIASVKGQVNRVEQSVADIKTEIAALHGALDALTERVAFLEEVVIDYPEEPEPPQPQPPTPPIADCTIVQLATPPMTMRMEALDQGPSATYAWKLGKNTDNDPAEDTATGRVLASVTYPDPGPRRVELTVTRDGLRAKDALTIEVAAAPPNPEPQPPSGEHGDLYKLDLANVADNAALKKKWVLYDGDAIIGDPNVPKFINGVLNPAWGNMYLVTEGGVKRQRHDFDRRGLSCANDVSCQCGNPRFAPQQEVYTRLRFATSPNWKAYDEACAAQGDTVGDMKLSFIDTVGGMSGRSGGILSHNNAQPGYPQGSIYMEESLPPKAPGVASRGEWIGVTFAPGTVYEIRHRWKYSTTSTSNDGHNEVWIYRVEASGSLTLIKNWKQTGFSTRGDTEDQPERTDGGSICHNQSTGPAIKMWIDVFEYDIWSAANKPSWAA